jgi:Flp pilus assembly protein TadD
LLEKANHEMRPALASSCKSSSGKFWHFPPQHPAKAASMALILAACLASGGCQNSNLSDITGSIGPSQDRPLPTSEPELRHYSEEWGQRYDSNPDNKIAAMNYARSLRALTQYAQAVAVMQRLAAKYPTDMAVLGAYGKSLADAGRLQEAADVLSRAHTPEHPNWSILSAQGSVADQLGDHTQAQAYYDAALKIKPDQPEVLSNLGLSYALAKRLPLAETTLEKAVAQPGADMRIRQNLALVLALQGKFNEAETISARDLAPIDAATNVAAIRQMISQSNTWQQIQKFDAKPAKPAPKQASANLN